MLTDLHRLGQSIHREVIVTHLFHLPAPQLRASRQAGFTPGEASRVFDGASFVS
jgi:hypothetical protein